MAKLAFLGLGAMGSRMAKRLVAAGHDVTVWNRTSTPCRQAANEGALFASSPRAAAMGADIVFSMVRDDVASRFVWLDEDKGALASMSKRSIAIECSTLTVGWVKELARRAEQRMVSFLDAPVAGSRPQAEAGQLIFFVGGKKEAVARAAPFLEAMGQVSHHVGPTGSGATVKLAVNALFALQVAGFAELIGMMKALGLDLPRAVEVIGSTPVASPAAKGAAASMLAGQFAPLFPVELVHKDLAYVDETAGLAQTRTPLASAAHEVMAEAIAKGYGDDNLTGIVRLYH